VKARWGGIVALGLALAVAVGASGAAARVSAGERQEVKKPVSFTLRIGDVLPFTGDLAAYGKNLDQAVRIAVALQNETLQRLKLAPAISVRLVASEDGQTSASASVEAATKLVKVNKVNLLIGEMASSATIPVAQSVAIPNRVVQITPTSTAPQISDIPDRGYLWRILSSDTLQGRVLAQAAGTAFGRGAKVAVGARNDAFGIALKNLFIEQFKSGGGQILNEVTWNPAQPTFDTEAARLVDGSPDGFVIIDFPETFEKVAPALVRTGKWRPNRTLMTEAMRNAEVLTKLGQQAVEGLRGTAPTSEGAPARKTFDQVFTRRARGANPITGFEGSSFDAAMLAFLAAVKAKSSNPQLFKQQLRAVSGPPGKKYTYAQLGAAIRALMSGKDIDYEGAWGPIDFDGKGDPGSAVYEIWRYSGGNITTQRTITFRSG
jgi:ABC-type branched-subunit amino acid transport system substrate-binding protein